MNPQFTLVSYVNQASVAKLGRRLYLPYRHINVSGSGMKSIHDTRLSHNAVYAEHYDIPGNRQDSSNISESVLDRAQSQHVLAKVEQIGESSIARLAGFT